MMRKFSKRHALAVVALATVGLAAPWGASAQQSAPAAVAPSVDGTRAPIEFTQAPSTAQGHIANVIGPDDQIVVRVAENPDLSDKPQRVDPNGEIRLPMIGRVQAAGLTPQQLEASITSRYKVFINEPDVMVEETKEIGDE